MFILGALAGGGQKLVALNLPHDSQHIDGPPLRLDPGGAKIHNRLNALLLPLSVRALILVHQIPPYIPR